MTTQEENWEMMTFLRIPWQDANNVTEEEDRKFLLEKCDQIKKLHEMYAREQQEQEQQEEGGIVTPPNNIITP